MVGFGLGELEGVVARKLPEDRIRDDAELLSSLEVLARKKVGVGEQGGVVVTVRKGSNGYPGRRRGD